MKVVTNALLIDSYLDKINKLDNLEDLEK